MLAVATTQKRATRGLPGSPKHPRPIRIKRPPAGTPLPTVQLPPPPPFDATSFAKIARLTPEQRVLSSADWICAAAAFGAPASYVETALQLSPGSLTGLVLPHRELMIRLCVAYVDFSNILDAEACRVLDVARRQKRDDARITVNQSSVLRARAEGYRRQSEGLLRKVALPQDRAESRNRGRFQRAWDVISAGHRAYLPAVGFVPSASATTPLEIAKELLPIIEAEYAARKADGEDTLLLAHQIWLTKVYVRRHSASVPATTPSAAQTMAAAIPGK